MYLPHEQMPAKRGWLQFAGKGRIVTHQPTTHLPREMHAIIAYSERERFERILIGGQAVEVEAAAGKLGRSRKGGDGRQSHDKAYVQLLGKRGGEVYLRVFAHLEGGV